MRDQRSPGAPTDTALKRLSELLEASEDVHDLPSRYGGAGRLARRGLRWLLRFDTMRQRTIDLAVLEALRDSQVPLPAGPSPVGPMHLAVPLSIAGTRSIETPWGPQWCAGEDGCGVAPALAAHLHRHLQPGDLYLDVGAGCGHAAALAAQLVTSAGKVVALEHDARLEAVLKANLWRAQPSGARVLSLAPAPFAGHPYVTGDERVPAAPVDALELVEVSVLRIGARVAGTALRGVDRTLEASPGASIVLEWDPAAIASEEGNPRDVLDLIASLGLRPWVLGVDGEVAAQAWHNDLAGAATLLLRA